MHFLKIHFLRCITAVGCAKKRHAPRCINKMPAILWVNVQEHFGAMMQQQPRCADKLNDVKDILFNIRIHLISCNYNIYYIWYIIFILQFIIIMFHVIIYLNYCHLKPHYDFRHCTLWRNSTMTLQRWCSLWAAEAFISRRKTGPWLIVIIIIIIWSPLCKAGRE